MQLTHVGKTCVWGGGGGGKSASSVQPHRSYQLQTYMSEPPHASRMTCVDFSREFYNKCGNLQLSSFQYKFTSRSRCCHLNSKSADLCKSDPEAGLHTDSRSHDVHLKVSTMSG